MTYTYVVSACLAGECCRYDGGSNPDPAVIRLVEQGLALPVCPERLADLPCPRSPCEVQGDKVVNRDGEDLTEAFLRGAELAMALTRRHGCSRAVLKARSPSCGSGMIYDGSFSKRLIPGDGLWTRLLRQSGMDIQSEETCISGGLMSEKSGLDVLWDLRLEEVSKHLKERNFAVDMLPDMAAAVDFFTKRLLPELRPASASVGGSETLRLGGVYDFLRDHPEIEYLDPNKPGISPEERIEIRRKALLVDLYVSSTNALTRDGRLLNLDGTGNRVAAMHFGPRKVVLFVGRNKIVDDLESARQRVKEVAAPANCIRLARKTPCVKTGSCMECKSPERICNVWTLTEYASPPGRIHILLINEDLGF